MRKNREQPSREGLPHPNTGIQQVMNQKYRSAAPKPTTTWKLQPLIHRNRRTAASGENSSPRECAEAEYFASVSVWGGLDHRLSEFLDDSES